MTPRVRKNLTTEEKKKVADLRFWERIEVVSLNWWNTGSFRMPKWLNQKQSVSEVFNQKEYE
jgi:hypothetical protein